MGQEIVIDATGPHGGNERFSFHFPACTHVRLGSQPYLEVPVRDERAAKIHAVITLSSKGAELVELGSLHGCRINGEPTRRRNLRASDVIQIGDETFVVTKLGGVQESSALPPLLMPPLPAPAHLSIADVQPEPSPIQHVPLPNPVPSQSSAPSPWSDTNSEVMAVPPPVLADLPGSYSSGDAPDPSHSEPEPLLTEPLDTAELVLPNFPTDEQYNTNVLVHRIKRDRRRTRLAAIAVGSFILFGFAFSVVWASLSTSPGTQPTTKFSRGPG